MLTKNEIKVLKSLRQRKFRQKYQKFVVENPKTATEFLRQSRYGVQDVYITTDYQSKYADVLDHSGKPYQVITAREMQQISLLTTASSIYITVDLPREATSDYVDGYYIYLAQVQDPGNVGTIIRIADWYGVAGVIRSPDSADWYNPKTVQATMGSMVNVSLSTATYEQLPPLPTYGALLDGDPIHTMQWSGSGIIIVGNESKGIPNAIASDLDYRMSIPGADSRIAESLNAAMATGIIIDRILGR